MRVLSIDIETFSSVDLKKSGVYKYTEAPDFEILLIGHALDDGPVQIIDMAGINDFGPDPDDALLVYDFVKALYNPEYLKTAHNANFERVCLQKYFSIDLPIDQWRCTMAQASMLGFPLGLDAAAKCLKLEAQKSAAGKALIKYFTVPCKPTKVNGGRTRNLPDDAPEKWKEFIEYCKQDVTVEREIKKKVDFFQQPEFERRLWILDQKINDRGIRIDKSFVENVIKIDTDSRRELTRRAIELTGLENPNSRDQLIEWLSEEGLQADNLQKQNIPDLLKQTDSETIKEVLAIRGQMSKTSIKKYKTMLAGLCADDRFRGLFQYYGANRTGRWAGRLVQVQNLPRISIEDIDVARNCIIENRADDLEMLYGNVSLTLSELIRTSFIAAPGHRLIVTDFSAIEARVIAWLSGEKWRLEVFKTHGRIYEASASAMFRIPLEEITKTSPYRQKGKIAELALGYQGGAGALATMDQQEAHKDNHKNWHRSLHGLNGSRLDEAELPDIVRRWRKANPAIVNYWYRVQDAAIEAIQGARICLPHGIKMFTEKGIFFIQLPSGRKLSYLRPKLRPGYYGQEIYYEGMDQTTKQWKLQQTYGGKLVENMTQAIARDLLAEKMLSLDRANYFIVGHVHDEIISDMPASHGSIDEVNKIMAEPLSWTAGLPLSADSFETDYYKKD